MLAIIVRYKLFNRNNWNWCVKENQKKKLLTNPNEF